MYFVLCVIIYDTKYIWKCRYIFCLFWSAICRQWYKLASQWCESEREMFENGSENGINIAKLLTYFIVETLKCLSNPENQICIQGYEHQQFCVANILIINTWTPKPTFISCLVRTIVPDIVWKWSLLLLHRICY